MEWKVNFKPRLINFSSILRGIFEEGASEQGLARYLYDTRLSIQPRNNAEREIGARESRVDR